MSDDRWERIKRIFAGALERPPEERRAYIEQASDGDAAIGREVESLLQTRTHGAVRTHGAADALAHATTEALSHTPLVEKPGSVIGPYKLLELIGQGGFGAVFLAEQARPVRRRVALKIIKLGMDTGQVVARFEAERQALALMDHPHIARVLDAGATDSGRPFFVMEYVTGDRITTFADARGLSVRERLELFGQVCAAIQHAHTKGVIHRDIKPGNVLVSMTDGRPFAKVIDFGIAKAVAQPLTDKTLFTEHRMLVGTPEYMSPEQAEGSADIDTRTDVYALGVLLYELLTGQTPFDGERLRSAARRELERIIREEEPLAPSVRLSRSPESVAAVAASRRCEPARLGGLVRGELDWIVMKALDKDRARRYESPNQLAADVIRHLSGEQVLAAPPSAAYRLRKFIRRNKPLAIGTAAVMATLAIGALGTSIGLYRSVQYERLADQRAEHAEWSDYSSSLALAQHALAAHDYPESRRLLGDTAQAKRGWEHAFLSRLSDAVVYSRGSLDDPHFRFTSDGAHLIVNDWNTGYWTQVIALDGQRAGLPRAKINTGMQTSVSPDSRAVATLPLALSIDGVNSSMGEDVGLWDLNGRLLGSIPWPEKVAGDDDNRPPFAFAFAPDERILTVSASGNASWWTATGQLIGTAGAVGGDVRRMYFNPSGERLVLLHATRQISVWSVDTSGRLALLTRPSGTVPDTLPIFSLMGGALVATREENTIHLWDTATGTLSKLVPATTKDTVWLSSDARWLGEKYFDATLTRVDDAGKAITSHKLQSDTSSGGWLGFSPDSRWVLVCGKDNWGNRGLAELWSLIGPEPRFITRLHLGSGESQFCQWSADSRFVSVLYDHAGFHRIAVHSIAALGGPERHYDGEDPELWVEAMLDVHDAGFAPAEQRDASVVLPDGSRIVKGFADGTVRFYEAEDGKPTLPPTADKPQGALREVAVIRMPAGIRRLGVSADGTRLVLVMVDGDAALWDIRDATARQRDLDREWEERVPATAYLDSLWNLPPEQCSTESLRARIIADQHLTPMRRFVAVTLFDKRVGDSEYDADRAWRTIADDQTDPAVVRARAAEADLPPRVKELVVRKAAEWTYLPPRPRDEERMVVAQRQLEAAQREREIADARLAITDLERRTLQYSDDEATWERASKAADTLSRLLGEGHADTVWAIYVVEERTLDELIAIRDQWRGGQAEGVDISLWSLRALERWLRLDFEGCAMDLRAVGEHLEAVAAHDPSHLREVVTDLGGGSGNWHSGSLSPAEATKIAAILREKTASTLRRAMAYYPNIKWSVLSFVTASKTRDTSPIDQGILALVRWKLGDPDSTGADDLAQAARLDGQPGSLTGGRVLTREEHRAAARAALAKARAIMAAGPTPPPPGSPPGTPPMPNPWADDADAKAIIADAAARIEGLPADPPNPR